MISKICLQCAKRFEVVKPSEAKRRITCSRSCATTYSNNRRYKDIGVMVTCKNCGVTNFERKSRQRKKTFCTDVCALIWRNKNVLPKYIKDNFSGQSSPYWKGEEASYSAKHIWIRKTYGKASKCERCEGKDGKYFEWANISGEYKRNKSDWMQLCRACHMKFDGHHSKRLMNTRVNNHANI